MSDLLDVAMDFNPESFRHLAVASEKRTFNLNEVVKCDVNLLLAEAFRKLKVTIRRKSLVERSQMILKHIPPQAIDSNLMVLFRPVGDDIIKRFDLLRHRIVHSESFADSAGLSDVALCGWMLRHVTFLVINAAVYFSLDYMKLMFQFYASGAAAKTVSDVAQQIDPAASRL